METSIKILYNGKEFENIDETDASDEDKLVTIALALDVESALEPLRTEIEKEGGEVTVNFRGPSMFDISTRNLSDKLKNVVIEALRPPKKK